MAKSKGKSRSTQVRSKLAIQVGERIRKTRKQEGLSIENFALRCDIHPSYVGHIERGMQNPMLSTLERISQGLGISIQGVQNRHCSQRRPEHGHLHCLPDPARS